MVFKFAANWQRKKDSDAVARGSLIFLIGSTISFAIAILSGVWVNPEAVGTWASAK